MVDDDLLSCPSAHPEQSKIQSFIYVGMLRYIAKAKEALQPLSTYSGAHNVDLSLQA